MRPDLTTFRILPWQDGTALVLCDAVEEHTGDFLQMAPRTILKKQLDRAKGLGLTLKCATELEFFLFRTDYDEAWKKRYRDLAPTSRYRADYHLLQSTRDEDFIGLVRDRLADAGIAVENAKTEWGLGQQEITLNYCDALMMADRHALYKHWVKEAASEFGYSATFMTLCNRIYVLDAGQIIASGTPEEVRNDPQVIEVYIGHPKNQPTQDH